MKATGIVRNVDELGRVTLPVELRRTFNIVTGDPLEIYTESDAIILKKYVRGCSLCGDADINNLIEVAGKSYCRKCAGKIADALKRA